MASPLRPCGPEERGPRLIVVGREKRREGKKRQDERQGSFCLDRSRFQSSRVESISDGT
ncbi:hypothetical protein M419DRAFT_124832 [Trichoderma reesei RUT C-30]|uniref:Uncharacterized protein n=1 Tax=Hypocrea jecorina (strain ATCC 56765 / BCRC 32924 / NRRL 11460 / Rut C-30) TaxID=1344414 RepID=A0A024RYW6_HYPJR|nr:hypothetical protein M419DRAFT_124832 [Trichoderma reesei RUT C-30]